MFTNKNFSVKLFREIHFFKFQWGWGGKAYLAFIRAICSKRIGTSRQLNSVNGPISPKLNWAV